MKSIIICVCPDTTQKTVCRHGPQSRLLGFCLFGPLVSLLILFCAAETRTDSLLIFKKPLLIFMKHWKTRSNSLLIFMISTNFFCQPKILKKSLSRLIFFNFQSALEKINCDWFFSILEPMGITITTLAQYHLRHLIKKWLVCSSTRKAVFAKSSLVGLACVLEFGGRVLAWTVDRLYCWLLAPGRPYRRQLPPLKYGLTEGRHVGGSQVPWQPL